jgi:hypothetical protein
MLKTGFFRQVRELKILRKNPSSALRLVKLQELLMDRILCSDKESRCASVCNLQTHAWMHIHVIIIILQFPLQKENPNLYYYHQ